MDGIFFAGFCAIGMNKACTKVIQDCITYISLKIVANVR